MRAFNDLRFRWKFKFRFGKISRCFLYCDTKIALFLVVLANLLLQLLHELLHDLLYGMVFDRKCILDVFINDRLRELRQQKHVGKYWEEIRFLSRRILKKYVQSV